MSKTDPTDFARFAAQKDITAYELALIVEMEEKIVSKRQYEILKASGTGLHRHFQIYEEYRMEYENSCNK